MRTQQKKYFSTKSQAAFKESVRLERIIDAEIERVNKLFAPQTTEQELF